MQFIRFTARSFPNPADNVAGISLATFLIIIAPMSDFRSLFIHNYSSGSINDSINYPDPK